MNDASKDIAAQFAAAGLVPGELVPQGGVSKVYVDTQDSELQAGINSVSGLAASAQQTANTAAQAAGQAQTTATAANQRAEQAFTEAASAFGISAEALAQAQKNAAPSFNRVNDIEATDVLTKLNVNQGTGIAVTTDPETKTLTITATGQSTPGLHASSHLTGGSDPIPVATTTADGLMPKTSFLKLENLGVINVKDYDVGTSAKMQAFVDSLAENKTIYFPDGTYPVSFALTKGIDLILAPNARIEGSVTMVGQGIPKTGGVTLTGGWATFPVGKTQFSGDFSALVPGDIVVIETGVMDGLYNQVGIDLLTVQSASATQLVTTQGTKFPYNNPTIYKATASIYRTGTVSSGSFEIPGNFTSIVSKGDLIRIDNRNGNDDVEGGSAYFEIARVVSISAASIILENRLTHSFTDFWVSRFSTIKDVRIEGGYIRDILAKKLQTFSISETQMSDAHLQYLYDFRLNDLDFLSSGTPQAFELTFAYSGNVANIRSKGARGITDNGNVKIMSLVNVVIDNVISSDSYAESEGIYPFFADYYYTPYRNWNDQLIISNVSVSGNKNVDRADIWIIGAKNSQFSNIIAYWWPKFDRLKNCIVSNVTSKKRFIVGSSSESIFTGINTGAFDVSELSNSSISDSYLTGEDNLFSRATWVRGSQNVRLENIRVGTGDIESFYFEQSNGVDLLGCSDRPKSGGSFSSVVLDAGVSNFRLGSNDFKKGIANIASASPTRHFGVPKAVDIPTFSLGRNSYAAKTNLTGDGTEYRCVFDGDGVYFNKPEYGPDAGGTFVCGPHLAGKYRFSAQIGLYGIASTHTIAQLYLKVNGAKIQLDYQNVSVATGTKSMLLRGQVLVQLNPGDTVQCFIAVAGTSKTVSWDVGDFGGRFSGEMIFAE